MKLVKFCPVWLVLILALLVSAIPAAPASAATGTIAISPATGPVGTFVVVSGTGFTGSVGIAATVYYDGIGQVSGTVGAGGVLPALSFPVPTSIAGNHLVRVATAVDGSNTVNFAVIPQIALSAASGRGGDTITVTGSGFAASVNTVLYFDGTAITSAPNSVIGTFTASLPIPQVTTGFHTITATDALSNSATATFTITSSITISPTSVAPGSQLTVSGVGFGASVTVRIYIDSALTTSTTSTTSGSFTVSFPAPQGVRGTHSLNATDTAGNSASLSYSVVPSITVSPTSVTGGSPVAVNGVGFAAGALVTFYIDNVVVSGTTATTNSVGSFTLSSLTIPAGPGGSHVLGALDSSGNSTTTNFSRAQVVTVSPQSGPTGTSVSVTGAGFGANRGIIINFDSVRLVASPPVPVTDASGNFAASFAVPVSSGGLHSVVVSDGTFSATASFTVVASATMNPVRGAVGTAVTVSGVSFISGSSILVTYDTAPVATATPDANGTFAATFNVPASATGTHTVNVSDGTRNIAFSFSVVANVTLTPASGYVGSTVTVIGTGFASGATATVKYDATQLVSAIADVNGGFSTSFKAPASSGGNHAVTVTDGVSTIVATFAMDSTVPPTPTLLSPPNDTQADAQTTFEWSAVSDPSGVTYVLQVATDSNFSVLILQKTGLTSPGYKLTEEEKLSSVSQQQPYYWRVRAIDGASNESPYSTAQSFYVGFVLAPWALYTIFGIAVVIAALLGLLAGIRISRRARR